MKENNQLAVVFPSVHGKKVVADFKRGVVPFTAPGFFSCLRPGGALYTVYIL
jgi:hypothetical protein